MRYSNESVGAQQSGTGQSTLVKYPQIPVSNVNFQKNFFISQKKFSTIGSSLLCNAIDQELNKIQDWQQGKLSAQKCELLYSYCANLSKFVNFFHAFLSDSDKKCTTRLPARITSLQASLKNVNYCLQQKTILDVNQEEAILDQLFADFKAKYSKNRFVLQQQTVPGVKKTENDDKKNTDIIKSTDTIKPSGESKKIENTVQSGTVQSHIVQPMELMALVGLAQEVYQTPFGDGCVIS
jgi:hypothetical protein